METLRFEVGPDEQVEFSPTDGTLDITLSSPHVYVSISLNAVHVRALLRCLPAMIQDIEASEQISEDVDLMNKGNVRKFMDSKGIEYKP